MLTDFFKKIILAFLNIPENPLKNAIRDIFYGEVITERIVEYALVFMNLELKPSLKSRILDIGCYYSNFPIQMASLGYKTEAVDLQDYQLTHPNFKFVKGDIIHANLPKNSYNIVTCISTLEHIGIGSYGDSENLSADRITADVVHSLLKRGGKFLITVPFGKKSVTDFQKSYDLLGLRNVLANYTIEKLEYYKSVKGKWVPTDLDGVKRVENRPKTQAIAFVVATKK